MQKVSEEQAREDFKKWLDSKKISNKKRASNIEAEDIIVEAIQEGMMVVTDENKIILSLLFPIESGNTSIPSLSFKSRLTVGQKHQAAKGIKPDDGEGRLLTYIAALSDSPAGVIRSMESGDDYERASAIAVYFL